MLRVSWNNHSTRHSRQHFELLKRRNLANVLHTNSYSWFCGLSLVCLIHMQCWFIDHLLFILTSFLYEDETTLCTIVRTVWINFWGSAAFTFRTMYIYLLSSTSHSSGNPTPFPANNELFSDPQANPLGSFAFPSLWTAWEIDWGREIILLCKSLTLNPPSCHLSLLSED